MGSSISIPPIGVGGVSACSGLEAEGQESSASFLRINLVILKLAPWSGRKPTPQGERS
jgi:hypothetical protein